MTRFLVFLVGVLFASSAFGASPDPKDLVIPPEVLSKARELVGKLGNESYREREDAHAELVKMGRLARPALLEAATNDMDPEVRFRCSRLLPKAGTEDMKARLETFLADTESKFEHDLPGMKQFRKTVGTDNKARELFVEMIKSPYNVELLQALDKPSADAGRAISDRRTSLYTALQGRVAGGRHIPGTQITLPDIACLLFAEAFVPGKDIPQGGGQWSYVTGVMFLQQGASQTALNGGGNGPHVEAFKKIVSSWLDTRDDPRDLNQIAHLLSSQLRGFPQSLPLLRKIVHHEGVQGYAKCQAITYLLQQRPKEEMPLLKKLLTDEGMVTQVWFGNGGPGQQHSCLMRDVALAFLITQTDQQMKDYYFTFAPGNPAHNSPGSYGSYAFTSDESRNAGMVKFGFWQLKQSFKEPVVKPGQEWFRK